MTTAAPMNRTNMSGKRNQPTPEQRSRVKGLAGLGLRQEEICAVMGLRSPKTLRRHYQGELSMGVAEATTKVRQTAFQLAMSGRDPRSTMFWLKTRMRWSKQTQLRERVIEEFVIKDYRSVHPVDRPIHGNVLATASQAPDDPSDPP